MWQLLTLSALSLDATTARAASIRASSTSSTSTQPPTRPIRILSTHPNHLAHAVGWPTTSDKPHHLWVALRHGLEPHDAATSHVAAKRITPRMVRELAPPACAPVCAAKLVTSTTAADGTVKMLVSLADGLSVECVLIPMHSGKHTSLCVSSQVGCARGCTFCSTGTMGRLRNLSVDEILSQVWLALRHVREHGMPKLVNVVFMGMGEPLDNFENVRASVEQLVDPDAFGFSRRNVVVSTVGTSPAAIRRAAALPCKLAWSVHAADDALRKMLVPTTAYPMTELRDELREALAAKPGGDKARVLLVEVALLGGVNDRPMHADQLAALLHPFGRGELIVNLIPYNENGLGIGGVPFRAAQTADVYRFQRKLWDHGLLCTVRAQRGHESSAACGQLATSKVTSMSMLAV